MKILLAIFLSVGCLVPLSAQEPMSMDSSVVNIGTISEDDPPAEAVFRFRNSGPDTLRILQLLTTCGCVRSSWTAAPVLPGACSSFSLSFAPEGHPGPVDRPVYVYYRAGDRSLMKEVRITGHVERSSDRFIRYRYRCGALRLMQDKVKMGQVGQSRRRVSRIAAGNGGCGGCGHEYGRKQFVHHCLFLFGCLLACGPWRGARAGVRAASWRSGARGTTRRGSPRRAPWRTRGPRRWGGRSRGRRPR